MEKWPLNLLCVFLMIKMCFPQDTEGGHEQWEYLLEDTGDVLQLALP